MTTIIPIGWRHFTGATVVECRWLVIVRAATPAESDEVFVLEI